MLHHYHFQARNYLRSRLLVFSEMKEKENEKKSILKMFYFDWITLILQKNVIQWSQQFRSCPENAKVISISKLFCT